MEFSELSAPTLKELFIRELESMILSGQLEVGQRLPPERELAEQMQVSRAVVNGGIADLARKGFLTVKPRAGVFVADYRRTGTPETFRAIMEYNGGHLRKEEIRSILEIKLMFDQFVAAQAIPLLTPKDEAVLDALIENFKIADQPQEAAEAAFEFYHELSLLGTNTLIPLIYTAFRAPNLNLWTQFARKYGCEPLYRNAKKFLAAIKARKIPAAQETIRTALNSLIDGDQQIY
jgi:DNA-binding FadR family transcriptional regulator